MTAEPTATAARHSSESMEHYTPADVVELARAVLGGIDLDPASCAEANRVVKAREYYHDGINGFLRPWPGRVFVNPPGGWCDTLGRRIIKARTVKGERIPPCTVTGECGLPPGHAHDGCWSAQKQWWQRLAVQWQAGTTSAALFVCFSVDLLQTTQTDTVGPLPLHFPICYPRERIAYTKPGGDVGASPTHASCLILLSDDAAQGEAFVERGKAFGHVVTPQGWPWNRAFARHLGVARV